MVKHDYDGPEKADKGIEGGSCNRSACQAPGAIWFNHGSYALYCTACKNWISDEWAVRRWERDFARCGHPQFETREMIDARKAG